MSTVFHRFKYVILALAITLPVLAVAFFAAGVAAADTLAGPISGRSLGAASPSSSPPELRATYSSIDPPGSTGTEVTGVIRTGALLQSIKVVGFYEDSQGGQHGFVMSGGHYTILDYPGSSGTTDVQGINTQGQIVGNYFIDPGNTGSFLYSAGTYTRILPNFYYRAGDQCIR